MTRVGTLALAAVLTSAPAAAQAWRPEEGDRALVFTLPTAWGGGGGSGGIGLWWQRSDRTALGMDLLLGFRQQRSGSDVQERTNQSLTFGLSPALKRYFEGTTTTAPFLRGDVGVELSRSWHDRPLGRNDGGYSVRFRLGGGFGIDWFPVQGLGIGGHAGIAAQYGINGSNASDVTSHSISVGTFTTGLSILFYF